MAKELAVQKYALAKPQDMQAMASVLKQHIIAHNLYTNIQGKNYVHVEGWQFAGGMMGTFPRIVRVEKLESGAWLAEAEIVQLTTQKVISRGFALCSKTESKKKSFDEYAVLSMAQTRAIGKAYRNVIAWVMKLAGYEGTPAEEAKPEGSTGAKAQTRKGTLEDGLAFIKKCKNVDALKLFDENVGKSKDLSDAEKAQLHAAIGARVDAL